MRSINPRAQQDILHLLIKSTDFNNNIDGGLKYQNRIYVNMSIMWFPLSILTLNPVINNQKYSVV